MDHTDLFTNSTSATPRGDMLQAMGTIMAHWNAKIPRRKFRVWHALRRAHATATLRMWTLEQILAAIDLYAVSEWHVRTKNWRVIDTWIPTEVCSLWCEKAMIVAEAKQWAKPAKDVRVQRLAEETAERLRVKSERERLLTAFTAFPAEYKEKLFDQAIQELRELAMFRRSSKKLVRSMDCFAVKMQVLVIMKRKAQAAAGEVGK